MQDNSAMHQETRIWGSDVIAAAIREQGFPYVCLTPGASFRGLHDSIVNYLGNERPKMLVALHEEHVIGIAQGYATVTDEPLAAIVHSNIGLMHATMGIFDAWCARVPVVVLGATGPVDASRRRPWIDWIHTSADQGSLVRHYTKWDDQPGSPAAAVESIRRATIIARTKPCGPVYINFDASIQEMELKEWPALHGPQNFKVPLTPAPAGADVDQAAQWLNAAETVFIFAGRIGRSSHAWNARIALAEALGASVVIGNSPGGFPTKHPLFFGEGAANLRTELREAAKKADVILALDYVDIGGTLNQVFPPGSERKTKVINCSIDHQLHNGWSMDYQTLPIADLTIATTPEAFTDAINPHLRRKSDTIKGRTSGYALPEMPRGRGKIGVNDLVATFLNLTDTVDTCFMGRTLGWPPNALSISHPLDWVGELHGAGVGAGPGIAVGAALALRDMGSLRLPVMVCGDGEFTMGCNALWTAAHEKIPLLLIVANNRSYFNDELHQATVARVRGRPQQNAWIGQRIEDPAPNIAVIAKGFGLDGAGPVEKLEDLAGALETAFAAVRAGRPYVLDVIVGREYSTSPITTSRKA